MKIFNSVAQMKLASLSSGQLVETKSYYGTSPSDIKGKGLYKILTPAQYPETVDGYVDHTLANGNVAKLVYEDINLLQCGARGDGVTDDGAAIEAALTKGSLRNDSVFCPAANYVINTDTVSELVIREIRFYGNGGFSAQNELPGSVQETTNFFIKGTNFSPFRVERGAVIENITVYYPDQSTGPTPVVYPPSFIIRDASDANEKPPNFITFVRVHGINPYVFCDIENEDTAGQAGHIFFDNCYIYGLHRSFDIKTHNGPVRFQNCTLSASVWDAADESDTGSAASYPLQNGIAVETQGGARMTFDGCIISGYRTGIQFSGGSTMKFASISNSNIRSLNGIVSSAAAAVQSVSVVNTGFECFNSVITGLEQNAIILESTDSTESTWNVANCSFRDTGDVHIILRGTGAVNLDVANNLFLNPKRRTGSVQNFCIQVNNSNCTGTISGNTFLDPAGSNNKGVSCAKFNRLKIVNNTFKEFQYPIAGAANSGTDLYISGNQTSATSGVEADNLLTTTAVKLTNINNSYDKASSQYGVPSVRATGSGVASVAATLTTMVFPTEVYDRSSGYNPIDGKFTSDRDCVLSISGCVGYNGNGAGDTFTWRVVVEDDLGNPTYVYERTRVDAAGQVPIDAICEVKPGWKVYMTGQRTVGTTTTLTIENDPNRTYLQIGTLHT